MIHCALHYVYSRDRLVLNVLHWISVTQSTVKIMAHHWHFSCSPKTWWQSCLAMKKNNNNNNYWQSQYFPYSLVMLVRQCCIISLLGFYHCQLAANIWDTRLFLHLPAYWQDAGKIQFFRDFMRVLEKASVIKQGRNSSPGRKLVLPRNIL